VGHIKSHHLYPQASTEYRISDDDFNKWRQKQQRKASLKKRRRHQQKQQHHIAEDEYDENVNREEEEEEEENYDSNLFNRHRTNKAAPNKKEHKSNKNYSFEYDSSNSDDKVYAKHPSRKVNSNKKQRRPSRPSKRTKSELLKKYHVYGIANVDAETSYSSIDPTAIDPGYYSTLPHDVPSVPSSNQDDIYSGLMSKKYNKNIQDKSKLLADINYNRKQQTKNLLQKVRGE
jgi:hypothetical protein